MKKQEYLKLYRQFQAYDGTLVQFCKSKRPHLKYDVIRVAFMRIKKSLGYDNASEQNPVKAPNKSAEKSEHWKNGQVEQVSTDEDIDLQNTQPSDEKITPLEMPTGNELTLKQQVFCETYMTCMNATGAYMEVYGCKYLTAKVDASRMLTNANVRTYINHHRSLARAKAQAELQRIMKRRIEISSTTLADVAEFGDDWLKLKPQKEIKPEHLAAIKKITAKKKVKLVPGTKDQVDEVLETEIGIELKDDIKVMTDLESSIRHLSTDTSAYSTDFEIHELWSRFQDQTRSDALSAIDFSHELSKRGYKVPESIQQQAKFELSVDTDPKGDDESGFDFDTLNAEYEAFQKHHAEELETFLPERKKEIKQLYLEQGFDEAAKQRDVVNDNDNLKDPDESKTNHDK